MPVSLGKQSGSIRCQREVPARERERGELCHMNAKQRTATLPRESRASPAAMTWQARSDMWFLKACLCINVFILCLYV